jgi:hypothetical protein
VANLLQSLRGSRSIATLDDYASVLNEMVFGGNAYGFGNGITQTLQGGASESIGTDLRSFATHAYASNGVVFACMAVRQLVFSAARFQWQQMNKGRPSKLFGTPDLAQLEVPWVGGTTQGLLSRMIQDVDLAGNSYWASVGGELVRMRPDWVQIVLEPRMLSGRGPKGQAGQVGYRRLGYAYFEGGLGGSDGPSAVFLANEVAHFAPYPDPLANYRGMSWLTPVLREIENDRAMNRHKGKFFDNGATSNMVVSLDKAVAPDKLKLFKELFEAGHKGVENAYKTIFLGGGADVKVVGTDFKSMDLKSVQGHGETRIAAAAGVPPVIVGLSEGLEAATYSNYAQARRRFADGTMHPLWQDATGSLAPVMATLPKGSRLWYDSRDIPFLREDRKDAADIQGVEARSIRTLLDAGYTPDSVVAAVEATDWTLLQHTGLFSVQLQRPGTTFKGKTATGEQDDPNDDPSEQDAADTEPDPQGVAP